MTFDAHEWRQLGSHGPKVFPLGLGCMGMSPDFYGAADEAESVASIHAALDAGVTLLDTGDYYRAGHNELLIGRALRDRRDKAVLSVKFGALRGADGGWLGMDTRPVAVKNFLAYSLVRLGVDHIDIYRPGRLDPNVPIEDTIGAIADLVKAGFVRWIGLSEVGPETIRRAHAVHPISDLQIEYSLISRAPEARIFPLLGQLGIGVTAYGVLSRGLLSGSTLKTKDDFRAHLPRFAKENLARNTRLVDTLRTLAAEKDATASQLAIAWVLAKAPTIVPSSEPAHERSLASRSELSTSRSRQPMWPASKTRCRHPRSQARGTAMIRCACSTANESERQSCGNSPLLNGLVRQLLATSRRHEGA